MKSLRTTVSAVLLATSLSACSSSSSNSAQAKDAEAVRFADAVAHDTKPVLPERTMPRPAPGQSRVEERLRTLGKRWRLAVGCELDQPEADALFQQISNGHAATVRQLQSLAHTDANEYQIAELEEFEAQLRAQFDALEQGHYLFGDDESVKAAFRYGTRTFDDVACVLMAPGRRGRCVFLLSTDPATDLGHARLRAADHLVRWIEGTVPSSPHGAHYSSTQGGSR